MRCNNCGFESEQNFNYCQKCGAPAGVPRVQSVSLNPAADRVLPALKDKLFLVLCILFSALCVFNIALDGIPVINILLTIFMWLAYIDASKGIVNEKHLRSISGTVYASYILGNIVSIFLIVAGVLMGFILSMITTSGGLTEEFTSGLVYGLEKEGLSEEAAAILGFPQGYIMIMGWAMCIALVLISVACLVINILSMKKIHGLAKSVYQGVMYQNPNFQYARATKGWLIFFAVCGGITTSNALISGEILTIVAALCELATIIIAIILVDKYLIPKANNIQ